MNKRTKKILIIGVIGFLLLINISALLTIILKNRITNQPFEQRQPREEIRREQMDRFMKDEFNFTREQFQEFRSINDKNRKEALNIAHELERKRDELLMELTKDDPDSVKLEIIAQEIGELHTTLKMITVNHFLELKEICTPAQQKVLHKMFYGLMTEENPMHRPYGRGKPDGRMQNRRNRR